jgi:branched-chain amino acid transport system substrate-binding protein
MRKSGWFSTIWSKANLTAFAGLLLALVAGGCGPRPEPEPFAIGQLISLTGPRKDEAEQARNGASLAVEVALRGDQRILGRRIAVRHVDDRGDPEMVQAEAVRLITLNRCVALLGGPDPSASERLARVAPAYGTPVLLTADLMTVPAGESVFCLSASPASRGEAIAQFAARDLHYRHIMALTDPNEPVGAALVGGFLKRWRQEHRGDANASVKELSYPKDPEWSDLIKRVAKAKPDAVLMCTPSSEFPQVISRFLAAGVKVPVFYGGEDRGTAPFLDFDKDAPPLYLATSFSARGELSPEGQGFVREYEEKFGKAPDLAAALAYDDVRMVIDALTQAQSVQAPRLTSAIAAENAFAGVTGTLSFADRRAKRRLFVVAIQGGEVKKATTIGPDLD